ncbi:uncharacterized protein ACLA_076300 [Aspergillus clavatus NRRL 1]|uniref:Integral membrane protein n=1 Tax=Aspergillus clavatus (strain ATCC 1007 / CBS 513.65 / DSM 816 / NCTC 3887 / NRRL 1 / QM 1276 / 107) TaxID=344612 RepID=A1C869_ASPCL|nr:uncharacterized protein ACLA_076300 [Aspergillus clavatus NRRL 1]EAW14590.1 hypothetical protein ACLA_076300 [Aspergillus clavatus NRRL 1]
MLLLYFLSLLVDFCLAQQPQSEKLEGWQFDDNSRSSWDIFWTCLSTIFACTWTAIHLHVPQRTSTKHGNDRVKFLAWLACLLAPEFMTMYAAVDFYYARSITRKCNQAFAAKDEEKHELQAEPKTGQPSDTEIEADEPEPQNPRPWGLTQGFSIQMDGLQFHTTDNWDYAVTTRNVASLIEAGLLQPHHLKREEIEDRAKADALAKLFAVLQSGWVMINILARAAYHLPISPLEIATVAYVVCAAFSYGLWWYMPRDVRTRITIELPYAREGEEMPEPVRRALDNYEQSWFRSGRIDFTMADFREAVDTSFPSKRHSLWSRECGDGSLVRFSARDEAMLTMWGVLAMHVFCGIHIAALKVFANPVTRLHSWNFTFPTAAERIAWRVFSLLSVGGIWGPIIIGTVPLAVAWLASGREISAPGLKSFIDPEGRRTIFEEVVFNGGYVIYALARLGMLVLVLTSMRALPAGSFVGIDWLSSIPHI